ncbi:E3 ubiquitin-protein ligase RNF180 [Spea bombifrons]|uniref:E3 ubiquitin-protein ligase RNF180 n=1 Tax=Spea bombifrons TaxID=233779 RepID=UPI002349A0A3|nr:E3 ubiquitin-protein ligase RNF180 [Spea bombifrons]
MDKFDKTSEEPKAIFRCWKCRKIVANSDCLIKDPASKEYQGCFESSIYHGECHLWHMDVEEIPDWMKKRVEQVHWTAGRLNCPYCGSRLGVFNFVGSPKCFCGQTSFIHLSKSRIDYDTAHSTSSVSKSRQVTKALLFFNKDTRYGVNGNQTTLTMDLNEVPAERLAEALCLEVPRTTRHTILRRTKLPLDNFSPTRYSNSKSKGVFRSTHSSRKKSYSLDCNNEVQLEIPPVQNTGLKHFSSSAGCSNSECFRKRNIKDHCRNGDEEAPVRSSVSTDPYSSFSVLRHPTTQNSNTIQFLDFSPPSDLTTTEDFEQQEPEFFSEVEQPSPTSVDDVTQRLTKREINKLKNIRRKQKRREKWLHEQNQTSKVSLSAEDDSELIKEKDSYTCAVCLDVYFNPYRCYPCHHVFCEPCLRTLARDNPSKTPCPLCRTAIARVYFQSDIDKSSVTLFPNEYHRRKQSFQRANCAKWPLPSCNRMIRVYGGFSRSTNSVARRQFPHGAHQLDSMSVEDETHGWRFDLDMVIIYIYSVNWVIGFIIFCVFCYFLFPSI